MEKSMSRIVAFAAIVAGTVGVSVSAAMAQGGAADTVQAEKPELVAAYERLVAQLQRGTSAPEPGPASLDPLPEDSAEIIAGYDRLFARVRRKVTILETNAGDVLRKGPNEWTAEERRSVLGFAGANQDLIRDIRQMADRAPAPCIRRPASPQQTPCIRRKAFRRPAPGRLQPPPTTTPQHSATTPWLRL